MSETKTVESSDDAKALLDEIVRNREMVDKDPADYPPKTRAGFAIAARAAKDALVKLEGDYVTLLAKRCVTVAVVGADSDVGAFRTLALSEGVSLAVDVGDVIRRIGDRVSKSIGHDRTWGTTQHSLTIQYALEEAVDIGLQRPDYDNRRPFVSFVVNGQADVYDAVFSTIVDRIGYDLFRAFVRTHLRGLALQRKLVPDKPVGVLITGARSEGEANEILRAWPSPAATVLRLEQAPTSEDVIRIFRKTQKSNKKSEHKNDITTPIEPVNKKATSKE